MEMRKKVLGAEHPDTLISMENLAGTYSSWGKWNKAEQLEVQVLDMKEKVLGPEHSDTLTSIENLASIYSSQEELEVQALMIKKPLGAEHPYWNSYIKKRTFDHGST